MIGLDRSFVAASVAFVASVQYVRRKCAYLTIGSRTVSDVVKPNHPKPLAPAVGKFGEFSKDDGGEGRRPTGCPSLEQFETRFLFANDQKHPPHAA